MGKRSRESDEEDTDSCRWFFFRENRWIVRGVEVSTNEGMFFRFFRCIYISMRSINLSINFRHHLQSTNLISFFNKMNVECETSIYDLSIEHIPNTFDLVLIYMYRYKKKKKGTTGESIGKN